VSRQLVAVVATGTDGHGARPGGPSALDVVDRVADDDCAIGGVEGVTGVISGAADRDVGKLIAVGVVAAEGADGKVVGEAVCGELLVRNGLDVSGDQSKLNRRILVQSREEGADAGEHLYVGGREGVPHRLHVSLDDLGEDRIGRGKAVPGQHRLKNGGVRSPGEGDAVGGDGAVRKG
jgi:hypothetical protein